MSESRTITIIALIGDSRVGKDTLASLLTTPKYNFKRLAFADPIKDVAKTLFNFTDDQCSGDAKDLLDERWNITPRQFFQQFGTEIMQTDIYKYLPRLEVTVKPRHFWSQRLLKELKQILVSSHIRNFVISDLRFIHELDDLYEFQNQYKNTNLTISIKTIKIIRPAIIRSSYTHTSNKAIEDILPSSIDHIIENTGTLEAFKLASEQLLIDLHSKSFNN
jgi:hypothetical protein